MSSTFIIYPSGNTVYGKASLAAAPWESDAVALTDLGGDLYQGDTDNPLLYEQAGGTPASTDTSVGDITDLYYGTVDEGNKYLLTRMHAWDWLQSANFDRTRALYHATMAIDTFNYIGCVSPTDPDQNLQWPRVNVDSDGVETPIAGGLVPEDIRRAAYLIADALLSGRDPEEDFEALATKVETFGPVRTEYQRGNGPPEHTANLIPSPAAWALIKPYLKIQTSFDHTNG